MTWRVCWLLASLLAMQAEARAEWRCAIDQRFDCAGGKCERRDAHLEIRIDDKLPRYSRCEASCESAPARFTRDFFGMTYEAAGFVARRSRSGEFSEVKSVAGEVKALAFGACSWISYR